MTTLTFVENVILKCNILLTERRRMFNFIESAFYAFPNSLINSKNFNNNLVVMFLTFAGQSF